MIWKQFHGSNASKNQPIRFINRFKTSQIKIFWSINFTTQIFYGPKRLSIRSNELLTFENILKVQTSVLACFNYYMLAGLNGSNFVEETKITVNKYCATITKLWASLFCEQIMNQVKVKSDMNWIEAIVRWDKILEKRLDIRSWASTARPISFHFIIEWFI